MRNILLLCLCCLSMVACDREELPASAEESFIQEREDILTFLSENNLNAEETESGLFYVIEEEGTGVRPDINSRVVVHYRGYLLNGTVFDSSYSRGQPTEFPLNNVILGWQEGIPLFKEGGNGILILPSKIAYGGSAVGSIGPFSTLVFEIELIEVK